VKRGVVDDHACAKAKSHVAELNVPPLLVQFRDERFFYEIWQAFFVEIEHHSDQEQEQKQQRDAEQPHPSPSRFE
jgi:hypothetical protein